jgi:mycothiol synthase
VPFCGEVGWTAVHPDHQNQGLGSALVSAVVRRFIRSGYSVIHLYTERWRLAALKMYLRLGFVPYLAPPKSNEHWHEICDQLGWSYAIEEWVSALRNL